jgi:4-oxalocrotonate tautomerase
MPLLNVKMIEGVFTPTQKQEMIRKLTDTMVSIEGENLRPYTLVVLEEVKSGDWGVAGNALTNSDARVLAAASRRG